MRGLTLLVCLFFCAFIFNIGTLKAGDGFLGEGIGCTNPDACNFDPTATIDSGCCQFGDCILIANDDNTTVAFGEPIDLNVLDNDFWEDFGDGSSPQISLIGEESPCLTIDSTTGEVVVYNDSEEACCGEHVLCYRLDYGGNFCDVAVVRVNITCSKPDCSLINLEDYGAGDDPLIPGGEQGGGCVNVCSNSVSTVFVPYNPTNGYSWSVSGGIDSPGANPAEIIVDWGAAGSGLISLTVSNALGSTTTDICVNILEGPTALFTSSGSACLDTPINFTNLSTSGADYFWDFGDGSTSTDENPSHIYSSPGTYTVGLTVTEPIYDNEGNTLCCCSAYYEMDVVVDPLPGPPIYCISTLCEGDSTCYWTDAESCMPYIWSVEDEFGNTVTFSGQGNDTICLTWPVGSGAFGVVSLQVDNCSPTDYCDSPTEAIIPIIPSTTDIDGPTVVCLNDIESYSLPKWPGTTYLWNVTGGIILDDDSSHTATIQWNTPGDHTIQVNYYNDFLMGLPNHSGDDCTGFAELDVSVRPSFDLTNPGPSVACVNGSSYVEATAIPSDDYTFTITPSVPFSPIGNNAISITWNTPGTYIITATPNDASVYCNAEESVVIRVEDIAPADAILGPLEICPGESYYYEVVSSTPGVSYNWSANDGVITPPASGEAVEVTWDASGTYQISVTQTMLSAPFCTSDPISISVDSLFLSPVSIGGGPACTNTLESYSVSSLQPTGTTYTWEVFPSTAGSVIGQGDPNIQIQWNNDPQLIPQAEIRLTMELCGQIMVESLFLDLNEPMVPTITQIGNLCPGVSADLDAGPGFLDYSWTGGGVPTTSQVTTINSAGIYSVTVEDSNNCFSTVYYEANDIPGPTANISSGDLLTICTLDPHTVTLIAQTNPDLEFQWYCGGVAQTPGFTPSSSFTHPYIGAPGTASFNYQVLVRDTNTGCEEWSNTLTVVETDNCPSGDCTPEPYSVSININPDPTNCNEITFSTTASNFTPVSWDFGDGNSAGGASPTHTYLTASCYPVVVTGSVPEQNNPGNFCTVSQDTSVCVPLAAFFDFDYISCDSVQFNDFSTIIAGPGNNIASHFWEFGSGGALGTSAASDPIFAFPPGSHQVTLTVTNVNGCEATFSDNVFVDSVGIPSIVGLPSPYCVDVPINFSATAVGAVSYFWDFGDGSTFSGASPTHTYTSSATYTVTVTAENESGCSATDSITIFVNPPIPDASITDTGLIICQGETTQLCAPPGYFYQWAGGSTATTQCIDVGAGTYSVTISDSNNCTLELDEVTVQEVPIPVALISGDFVICDAGCVTLEATLGGGYSYEWLDDTGSPLIPAQTGQSLEVCDFSLLPGYQVVVTNSLGCSDTSTVVNITVETSPSFTIDIAPDPCAGSPTTLSINPVDPDVSYSWSNGQTGPSIVVSAAGVYTAIGTHNITGCQGIATAEVFPLPDLCIVPFGCYEACNPDTICAPDGLSSYQWNFNGSPLAGETSPCLIVTNSGSYTVTATNEFGCTSTSEPLILELINCDDFCEEVSIDWSSVIDTQGNADDCCFNLSYLNNAPVDLSGIDIRTNDGDLVYTAGSLDPALDFQSVTPSSIVLGNAILGDPLPVGALNNFITLCIENAIVSPQEVIIDWIDGDNLVACSDTILIDCPVEPDCLYLTEDTIFCENGSTFYEFTICNPNDNPYDIGYVSFAVSSPVGITLSPPSLDLSGSPLAPGDCGTYIIELSGPGIAGQDFCFQLTAHESDPAISPDTPCCTLDETYCITIPECDPCVQVGIETVNPVQGEGDCCFDIALFNDYDPAFFDEIGISTLDPLTTFTVNNPFGSGWLMSGYDGQNASLIPDAVFGGFVPGSVFTLPEICVDAGVAPPQLLEIQWISAGNIVCRDTIQVDCEPDCGYMTNKVIDCDPDGFWSISGMIHNTSDFSVGEVVISYPSSTGLDIYNTTIPAGIPPGASAGPFNFNIGAPAMAGDTICANITLHELTADGLYLECCTFVKCFVLPDCGFPEPCDCTEEWYDAVAQGIECVQDPINPLTYTFSLVAADYFNDCDLAGWRYLDGSPIPPSVPAYLAVSHTYTFSGNNRVCVKVIRTADDGTVCTSSVCKDIVPISVLPNVSVYPNPSEGHFMVSLGQETEERVDVLILDNLQRVVRDVSIGSDDTRSTVMFDLIDEPQGVYFVQVRVGEEVKMTRLLIGR